MDYLNVGIVLVSLLLLVYFLLAIMVTYYQYRVKKAEVQIDKALKNHMGSLKEMFNVSLEYSKIECDIDEVGYEIRDGVTRARKLIVISEINNIFQIMEVFAEIHSKMKANQNYISAKEKFILTEDSLVKKIEKYNVAIDKYNYRLNSKFIKPVSASLKLTYLQFLDTAEIGM